MRPSLTATDDTKQLFDLISAQLRLIQARLELKPRLSSSPWLPLAEAARALHFPSSRALRAAIDRGRIPPQFVSATTGDTGKRRTLYVDVEGFSTHLRTAQVVKFAPYEQVDPTDGLNELDGYPAASASTGTGSRRWAADVEEVPF